MDGARFASAPAQGPDQTGRSRPPPGFRGRNPGTAPRHGAGFMSESARQSSAEPRRVGYVLKMFPRLSETFILNEVLELERQDMRLHIFSLKRPVDAVSHPQARA